MSRLAWGVFFRVVLSLFIVVFVACGYVFDGVEAEGVPSSETTYVPSNGEAQPAWWDRAQRAAARTVVVDTPSVEAVPAVNTKVLKPQPVVVKAKIATPRLIKEAIETAPESAGHGFWWWALLVLGVLFAYVVVGVGTVVVTRIFQVPVIPDEDCWLALFLWPLVLVVGAVDGTDRLFIWARDVGERRAVRNDGSRAPQGYEHRIRLDLVEAQVVDLGRAVAGIREVLANRAMRRGRSVALESLGEVLDSVDIPAGSLERPSLKSPSSAKKDDDGSGGLIEF